MTYKFQIRRQNIISNQILMIVPFWDFRLLKGLYNEPTEVEIHIGIAIVPVQIMCAREKKCS